MRRRPVPVSARRRTTLVTAGALLVSLAACTSDPDPLPAEPQPPAFECDAVGEARAALDDRGAAELERLGLGPGDPQALTVTVVAAGTGAPPYWSAVQDALADDAPAALAADVGVVRDYWAALEPELARITIADAEPATVQAAGRQLSALASRSADDDVAPAQDRVEDALRATCGG